MKIENKIIKTELFKWRDLIPLQPKNFKELSKANYEKLKTSIINNNFVMSFTVWDSGAGVFIIDGVHRFKVLDLLEKEGAEIPELLPCTFIQCENKKEASKLVLIYSSIYAKTQDEGLYEFLNLEGLDFEALKIEIDIPNIDWRYFEDIKTDYPEIATGDKEPFEQMTFILHTSQAENVRMAIQKAKSFKPETTVNENSNGNALNLICEKYLIW
jgi:hypothetical protein